MRTPKKGIACLLLASAISCSKMNDRPATAPTSASDASNSTAAFKIGQTYHGGIIFYIDSTRQHGLIASKNDLVKPNGDSLISWEVGPNLSTGAGGYNIGDGASNTAAIVAAIGDTGHYAALLCSKYKTGIYQDWYLPSLDELLKLLRQRAVIGNLKYARYWSSTEWDAAHAWSTNGGSGRYRDPKHVKTFVRAVSSF